MFKGALDTVYLRPTYIEVISSHRFPKEEQHSVAKLSGLTGQITGNGKDCCSGLGEPLPVAVDGIGLDRLMG